MGRLQYFRILSILAALLVGFWLPLRLINYHLPFHFDVFFDLLISAVSVINVYLYFVEHEKSFRDPRAWLNPGLLLDLICVLPLSYLDVHFVHSEKHSLLLFNLLTARHITRIKAFLDGFHSLPPVVYRLAPIGLMMPLLVHLVACGWIALGSGSSGPDADQTLEYVRAMYWAFTTLTTVGYGDITPKTAPQILFTCGVQVIGVGVFGFVLSNVASLLSRMDAARENHMENLDRVETFMQSHRIPPDLRNRVRSYFHYLWKSQRGYHDQALLEDLPGKMQSELILFINKSIVEKVPLLKGASDELIEDLMGELKPRIVVPGERIFRIDDPGDALYFIHNGHIEIVARDTKVIAELEDGAFFGEMALISDKPRSATARAKAYTHLYVLPKASFQRVLTTYPAFREQIESVARERQTKVA